MEVGHAEWSTPPGQTIAESSGELGLFLLSCHSHSLSPSSSPRFLSNPARRALAVVSDTLIAYHDIRLLSDSATIRFGPHTAFQVRVHRSLLTPSLRVNIGSNRPLYTPICCPTT